MWHVKSGAAHIDRDSTESSSVVYFVELAEEPFGGSYSLRSNFWITQRQAAAAGGGRSSSSSSSRRRKKNAH
jgi:hypothetical protein